MSPELKQRILSSSTKGGQLHAILACVLGIEIPAPHYSGRGIITSDGFLIANFRDRAGNWHYGAFVGSYAELERNIEGLVEWMKLPPKDRAALRLEVLRWISQDYRTDRRVS